MCEQDEGERVGRRRRVGPGPGEATWEGYQTWSAASHRLPSSPDSRSGVGEPVAPRSKEQKGAPPFPGLARCDQSARPLPPTPSDWLGGYQWGAGAASWCGPTWGSARRLAGRGGRGAWILGAPQGLDGDLRPARSS